LKKEYEKRGAVLLREKLKPLKNQGALRRLTETLAAAQENSKVNRRGGRGGREAPGDSRQEQQTCLLDV